MQLFGLFLFSALVMPDFSQDRFLLGHWKCAAQNVYGRSGSEDAHYSLILGGRWLFLQYTLMPNDDQKPVEARAYETFDPAQKKWIYTSFNSLGSYGTSVSEGWNGNTKTYTTTKSGHILRLVVTRITGTEVLERGGRSVIRCKKQQR